MNFNSHLFIDFETFMDSKDGYDLRKMSMVEYVRDPRFKIHMMGWRSSVAWGYTFSEDEMKALVKDKIIVAHNIKFDSFILAERLGIIPKQLIDTKAMAKAVLGNRVKGYSLRELAAYFGLNEKGQMKTDGIRELTEEQRRELTTYCINDTLLCSEIFGHLVGDFPESEYPVMDWTIRSFIQPKLALDVQALELASIEEAKRRELAIAATGIDKKVFSSNSQFAELLMGKGYKVPTKKSPRTGEVIPALALGDVDFVEMSEDKSRPELYSLCQARIAAKSTLLETRTAKLAKIGKTGLWPFDIGYSGAVQTHRFSGSDGSGGNPQNFTKGSALRKAVKAPKGYKIICGDFSQIEARLVAYLSQDPGLIGVIETQPDLYCDFGSAFYGRIITKLDKEERDFAKTAILGLGYNMGSTKFKKTVRLNAEMDITEEDAKRAVNLYRQRYNRVPALWKFLDGFLPKLADGSKGRIGTLPLMYEKEAIILPSGLKMQYPELQSTIVNTRFGPQKRWTYKVWETMSEKEERDIYGGKLLENICQGLAGEICKSVIRDFSDITVGQVHDELLLLVKEEDVDETISALYVAMTTAPEWLSRMKLATEIHAADNWLEAK